MDTFRKQAAVYQVVDSIDRFFPMLPRQLCLSFQRLHLDRVLRHLFDRPNATEIEASEIFQ